MLLNAIFTFYTYSHKHLQSISLQSINWAHFSIDGAEIILWWIQLEFSWIKWTNWVYLEFSDSRDKSIVRAGETIDYQWIKIAQSEDNLIHPQSVRMHHPITSWMANLPTWRIKREKHCRMVRIIHFMAPVAWLSFIYISLFFYLFLFIHVDVHSTCL